MRISIFFLLMLFFLFGCRSIAENYYNNHKGELAEKCAAEFPVIDREGTPEIDTPFIDNQDYTGKIDSLQNEIADLNEHLNSLLNVSPSDTCAKVLNTEVVKLQKKLSEATRQVEQLKGSYKPCDTSKIIIRIPTIRIDAALHKAQSDSIQTLNNKYNNHKDKLNWWRIVAIVSIAINALIIAFLILRK